MPAVTLRGVFPHSRQTSPACPLTLRAPASLAAGVRAMPAVTLPGVSCTHGRPVPDVTSTQVACTPRHAKIKPWFDPAQGLRYPSGSEGLLQ